MMRVPIQYMRFFSTSSYKPKLELLSHRCLLKMKGQGLLDYCQRLMTNDIFRLNTEKCLYTTLLNSKGRVMYDCLLYKVEDHLLIECDKVAASSLCKHLKTYALRKKIEIDIVDDASIWVLFSPSPVNVVDNSTSVFDDPRLPILGQRILSDNISHIKEQIVLDEGENKCSYKKWRYSNGVAEGVELLSSQSFPLEMNCDYLNGISFHKGCYIGQELTARTHHTGVIRKRIMPIIFDKEIPSALELNADIYDKDNPDAKRPLGKLRGLCDNVGIANLRIDECLKAKNLVVGGYSFKTFIPNWWKH
ncbi:putative transferase CAF17 homolog, mitochondrial isoform X1 [Adelges cooleyi]|uniref:putative transferase CAF17 homolog, mitochondrial isoform X1 n=1 Tax=Adelges cooleyi TaxID=133065 RepID=UPI0021804A38|nr:putative transferase CAF17 homolog, mitochondrial isoform X1 [Adelges cooleyi]